MFETGYFSTGYFATPYYMRGALEPFTPEPVHPPGMGTADMRRWIQEEDDMLIAIIMAFLRIKDD